MKKTILFFCISLLSMHIVAQQSMSIGDTQTKANAVLYLKGNGTQGLIIPVVTAVGAFGESGMMVFNSTDKKLYYHNGTTWVEAGSSGAATSLTAGQNISITGASPNFTISAPNVDAVVGNEVTQVNTTRGGLETSGAGTAASPLSIGIIQGTADGQVLKWNHTTKKWELGTITGGAGTVTSVGLAMPAIFTVTGSPVTAAGSLTATLNSQAANTVFAGPAAAAGAPAFRSLVANDIPNLDAAKISTGTIPANRGGTGLTAAPANGQLPIGNGAGYTLSTLTAGSGITITNGAGTVSIASTGLSNPMTTAGDIIVGGASGTPARLAGSAGFLKSTGAAAPAWGAVNLASADATGTLPLTKGGTGATTAAGAQTNLGLGSLATLAAVSSTEITDGSIMNVDVNAAAAIAGSKISPNFTQNVTTTGNIGNTATPLYPVDVTTPTDAYGFNHTDGAVIMSTYTGNGGVYGGAIGTQSSHPFFIYTDNDGADVVIMNGTGNVGIGSFAPSSKLEVNGFTKLGSDVVSVTNYAPAIKVRKVIINSPSSQGTCTNLAHGIPADKIISVTAIMEYTPDNYIPSGYTYNAGYLFDWVIAPSANIQICTIAGQSAQVLSKPVIVTITYEQ